MTGIAAHAKVGRLRVKVIKVARIIFITITYAALHDGFVTIRSRSGPLLLDALHRKKPALTAQVKHLAEPSNAVLLEHDAHPAPYCTHGYHVHRHDLREQHVRRYAVSHRHEHPRRASLPASGLNYQTQSRTW